MILELIRDLQNTWCTLGTLALAGKTFQTIERPWVPNAYGGKAGAKYESCVGPGDYRLLPHERPSGERCWALSNPTLDVYYQPEDVPIGREKATRTLVLIHTANWVKDVIGCIGPGKKRVKSPQGWMVTESRAAMNEIRQLMSGQLDHTLMIRSGT